MFKLKGAHQLVLCGLGVHTLPVRVFNPAELVVLDLKKGRKD
jgi:predicted MPP superfamily phosphohydrolase